LIAAIFSPFMDSFTLYGALLGGKKLFDISTKYRVITQIISVSILIATLFLTKNVFLILFAYFISYTSLRFIFLKITLKKISLNQKEDPKTLPYGKYLSLLDVIGTISNYLDRVLVFHYLGAIELAIYSFAIIPSEQIKGFLKVVHSLALPKFAQREKEEIKKTVFKKMVKFSFFIAIIVILYIILAPFLYKIIFPQYMDSVFCSQIFSISLITAIAILPTAALQAKMAKKQLYQLNIYSSLIQIAMLFLFIHFYGLLGVILARIIYRFINAVLLCFLIKKI